MMQSTAGLQVATTTAAIHEFVCLFTHDLVRKQKRWQDGRLKYHTHNNRIVVHDDRGNSVGDHHWVSDYAFDEGEEFRLDRGSVIVQVNECVGTRLQDLSELVDKRAKEREERRSAALSKKPVMPRPPASGLPTPNRSLHQLSTFKPLQKVVGTPTGHHGRALVPAESPFEQRQKQASIVHDDSSPPAKRRRHAPSPLSKKGYAQSLFGATLSLSSQPQSSAPLRVRHVNTSAVRQDSSPTFPSSTPVEPEKPTSDLREQSQHLKAPVRPISTGSSSVQARKALPSLLSSRPQEMPMPVARKETQSRNLLIVQENEDEVSAERPKKPTATSSGRRLIDLHQTLDRDLTRNKQNKQTSQADDFIEIQSSNESHSQPVTVSHKRKKSEKRREPERSIVQDDSIVEIQSEDGSGVQHAACKPKVMKRKKGPVSAMATTEDDLLADPDDGASEKLQTRHRKTASQVPKQPSPPAPAIGDDHPRTELRIKPRKKRGLLMLSRESSTTSKTAKSKELNPLGDDVRCLEQQKGQYSAHEPSPPPERAPATKIRRTAGQSKSTPFLQSEDEEQSTVNKGLDASASRKPRRASEKASSTGKRDRIAALSLAEVGAEPDDASLSEEVPKHKRRRKGAQKSTEIKADSEGLSEPEDASLNFRHATDMDKQRHFESVAATDRVKSTSGPRLARFARKDIRSKEIIGFDFEDEDNVSNFNNFTAASFGMNVAETAAITVSAPETVCIEAVEVPGAAEGSDQTETIRGPSAMLLSIAQWPAKTTNISTSKMASSEGLQKQEATAALSSHATDGTTEMVGAVVNRNQATAPQSEGLVAISVPRTSTGQSRFVGNETTGSAAVLNNTTNTREEHSIVPSLFQKGESKTTAMEAPTHEDAILEANNEQGEKADDRTIEAVQLEGKKSDTGPNPDQDLGANSETKASPGADATISNPFLSTASENTKCFSTDVQVQDADATARCTQDENVATAIQSDGSGRVSSKPVRMSIQSVQEQIALPSMVGPQATPSPVGSIGKSHVLLVDTIGPTLSNAPRSRTRVFSRAKSMSTAEAGTTKPHKPSLSRQSSAAAKIATGDAKSVSTLAETPMTSNTPPLSSSVSVAGQDLIRVKPTITTARLANPATRGRKAAKPSDAAGQAPQCPLPLETQMTTASGLGRLRGVNARPFKTPATVPVSRTTPVLETAPAFTTASGDPWSREAFDLFEFQRPS